MKYNYFKNLTVPSLKDGVGVLPLHVLQERTLTLERSKNGFRDPEGPVFRTSNTVHNSEPLQLIDFSNSPTFLSD